MKKYTVFELNTYVKELDGTECKLANSAGTAMVHFTVREAFRKSLGATYAIEQPGQGMPGISFEQKIKRYNLSERIWNAELSVEVSTEEQADLKKCVGMYFNIEPLGFLEKIIEGRAAMTEAGNGVVDMKKENAPAS